MSEENQHIPVHGRGAGLNTANPFSRYAYTAEHLEGIDEPLLSNTATRFFNEHARHIVNKVESPDTHMGYSMNPYQGCEHGCIYCYARNSHHYWGFSAGLDFERNIVVKHNAPALLEKQFLDRKWEPAPILLSGNTDCYQPVERKLEITRKLLAVCLKYRNPVSIITKNSLILRDIDILSDLAKQNLVHVMITVTTLKEELRLKMEPRTVTGRNRLRVIGALTKASVPVGVMTAPLIPGLNSEEMPGIIRNAADHGASTAGYTIVRLNGSVGDIFREWLYKNFPDAAEKVMNQVAECHGGKINDSRFGTRMKGEGLFAEALRQVFKIAVKKYMKPSGFEFNLSAFTREPQQYSLF